MSEFFTFLNSFSPFGDCGCWLSRRETTQKDLFQSDIACILTSTLSVSFVFLCDCDDSWSVTADRLGRDRALLVVTKSLKPASCRLHVSLQVFSSKSFSHHGTTLSLLRTAKMIQKGWRWYYRFTVPLGKGNSVLVWRNRSLGLFQKVEPLLWRKTGCQACHSGISRATLPVLETFRSAWAPGGGLLFFFFFSIFDSNMTVSVCSANTRTRSDTGKVHHVYGKTLFSSRFPIFLLLLQFLAMYTNALSAVGFDDNVTDDALNEWQRPAWLLWAKTSRLLHISQKVSSEHCLCIFFIFLTHWLEDGFDCFFSKLSACGR